MDLEYFFDINNLLCYKILENLNFVSCFNILKINKIIYNNFINDNKFWHNCCIKYKNKFFWKLAMMRSENKNWLCNKDRNFKQELRNLYFYDNLLSKSKYKQNNITYYYQWIMIEYYNDNFDLAYKMLNCLFDEYFKKSILNSPLFRINKKKNLKLLFINFNKNSNKELKKNDFENIMNIISNLYCN